MKGKWDKLKTDRQREIQICANTLGKLTRTIPNISAGVARIWEEMLDCYELDETLAILEEAHREQHLVVTAHYPKFYAQHVKFYSIRYWTGTKTQQPPESQRRFIQRLQDTFEIEDDPHLSTLSPHDVRAVTRRRVKSGS